MTTFRTVIHDRRIDAPAPDNLPDGTEVELIVTQTNPDNDAMMLHEIARVLAAMQQLEPLALPDNVAAELDDWEAKLNQHGIDLAGGRSVRQVSFER